MNTLKTLYQLTVLSIFSLLAWVMLSYAVTAKAAPPPTESNQSNTKLNINPPAAQEANFSVPIELNMPAQPLAASLKKFGNEAGISLAFDSASDWQNCTSNQRPYEPRRRVAKVTC